MLPWISALDLIKTSSRSKWIESECGLVLHLRRADPVRDRFISVNESFGVAKNH